MQKAKARAETIEKQQRKIRKYKREYETLFNEKKANCMTFVERPEPLFMGYKLVFKASGLGKRKYGEALQEVIDEVAPFIVCNDRKFNFKDAKVWHGYWCPVVYDKSLEPEGNERWFFTTKNWFDKSTGNLDLRAVAPDGTAWSGKKSIYNKDFRPWLGSHSDKAKELLGWPKEKENELVEKLKARKGWKGCEFIIDGGFLKAEDYVVTVEKWMSKYKPALNGDLISMEDFYHKKLYVQDRKMWHLDEYRGCDAKAKFNFKSKRYYRKKGKTSEKAQLAKIALEDDLEDTN